MTKSRVFYYLGQRYHFKNEIHAPFIDDEKAAVCEYIRPDSGARETTHFRLSELKHILENQDDHR